MKKKQIFIGMQVLVFLIITAVAATVIVCFPNPPSFIREFAVKHRVYLSGKDVNPPKPDKRFLAWFNRDPDRKVPAIPRIIVSPADGFVERILKKNGRIHLIVEMRYTDVHVQRVPITGKVMGIKGGGKEIEKGFNIMDYELEKMMPFQKVTTFQTEIGTVVVRQITSFFAKRITVFLKVGQTYKIGTRLGNVLAGSTVVLEIPDKVQLTVKKDDEVLGGETIMARY